jgi:hypothetical protein
MAAFDKTARSENASQRLRKHLQENSFLLKIKTKIDQNPANYRTIIQDNMDMDKIPIDGAVLTLAVLTEWKKAETMDDLHNNETWKLVQKPTEKTSTPESSEKHITKKSKTEQAHERVEQAHKRRSSATRKVTSKKSAVEILRDQRKSHEPPKNTVRYSHGVMVSSTHKVGKTGYGGGNRRTAKNHRKPQKN